MKSGRNLESTLRLWNQGDHEVVTHNNGRVTARVIDPETMETVGGFSGAQTLPRFPSVPQPASPSRSRCWSELHRSFRALATPFRRVVGPFRPPSDSPTPASSGHPRYRLPSLLEPELRPVETDVDDGACALQREINTFGPDRARKTSWMIWTKFGGMDVPARSLVACTTHNADTRSLKQILLLTAPLTSVHREVPSG